MDWKGQKSVENIAGWCQRSLVGGNRNQTHLTMRVLNKDDLETRRSSSNNPVRQNVGANHSNIYAMVDVPLPRPESRRRLDSAR